MYTLVLTAPFILYLPTAGAAACVRCFIGGGVSAVLQALGMPMDFAVGTLRLSFGAIWLPAPAPRDRLHMCCWQCIVVSLISICGADRPENISGRRGVRSLFILAPQHTKYWLTV